MNLLLLSMLMIGWQDAVQKPPAIQPPATKVDTIWNDVVSFEIKTYDGAATSLEQAITQALTRHPEMQLAQAELRVAEAKLAQARIVVSQKVTEDFHRLEKERADVTLASANWERISQLQKKNMVSKQEVDESQHQLAQAKARLATTESSWKLMMGNQVMKADQAGSVALLLNEYLNVYRQDDVRNTVAQFYRLNANEVYSPLRVNSDTGTPGSIDQLKINLEVKVKLDKQTNLDLEQAFQKVTDGAGVKIRVRLPITENKTMYKVVTHFDLEASEYPLHTWLQLIVDEMNSFQTMSAPQRQETPKRFDLYVREYGLLLTSHDLAPPDALTVQELWKQARLEKAAKEAKKAQENVAPKK